MAVSQAGIIAAPAYGHGHAVSSQSVVLSAPSHGYGYAPALSHGYDAPALSYGKHPLQTNTFSIRKRTVYIRRASVSVDLVRVPFTFIGARSRPRDDAVVHAPMPSTLAFVAIMPSAVTFMGFGELGSLTGFEVIDGWFRGAC